MSSELISVAARKREEVLRKIEEFSTRDYVNEVRKLWVPYTPLPRLPKSVAGVDGSNAKMDFQGFTLYGVTAAAIVCSDLVNNKEYGRMATLTLADLDVLSPPQIAERISIYREILEAKVAIQAMLNGAEFILMDGSLKSMLITPSPLNQVLLTSILEEVSMEFGDEVFTMIESKLTETLRSIDKLRNNPLIAKEVAESFIDKVVDERELQMVIALEYIEKLSVIRRLISDAYLNNVPVLFISKTSRSQTYVKEVVRGRTAVTDIMLFQYLTKEPGFSRPYLEEKPIKEMPKILKLKEFYDRLRIISTYVRLGANEPVLKVEIPYLVSESHVEGLDEVVKEVADILKSLSSNGYPYPLYEAHKVTYLGRDLLHSIAGILGISSLLTGREVLGE